MSHFAFLAREWPAVFEAAPKAEAAVRAGPRTACLYARRALELAVRWAYRHDAALMTPAIGRTACGGSHQGRARAADPAVPQRAGVRDRSPRYPAHHRRSQARVSSMGRASAKRPSSGRRRISSMPMRSPGGKAGARR